MSYAANTPPPCLLTYQFSTQPAPIQASTANVGSNARINVWVSSGGTSIYCNKITIAVPIGPTNTDLSENTPSVTPNTTRWVISSMEIKSGAELGLDAEASYAIFYIDCVSSEYYLINYDLVFSMLVQPVNSAAPGDFQYIVVENSGTTSDPSQFQQRRNAYTLHKDTPQLYLNNFVSTSASSAKNTAPRSVFANGEAIRLIWESNGSSFSLYAAGQSAPIYSGKDTAFVLGSGLTNTTTFTLLATMSSGQEFESGSTTLSATLDITISNPDVAPRSATADTLSVVGPSTLKGDATLGNATVGGTLTTSGAANLNGSTTLANLTVNGASTLKGDATLGNATVGGTLNATGNANLANAVATRLTVQNAVSMLNARGVNPGNYTASTDGLVVGIVSFPSDPSKKCIARLYGQTTGGMTVWATGGNMVSWMDGDENYIRSNNPNSFVLPVQQGQAWSVSVQQSQYNEVSAPTAFYWVPFGKNASQEDLRELSDEEAAAFGLNLHQPMQEVLSTRPPVEERVAAVVDAITAILGNRLSTEQQQELTSLVTHLASHPALA